MKYNIGDKLIHKSHGLGTLVKIETRAFANTSRGDITQEFYILEIQDNGFPKKVFVPVEGADAKIRLPIHPDKVSEIYSILKNTDSSNIDPQTWNRRYREYMEKIHTGDLTLVAEVLRELRVLKQTKDLSFGERTLLNQAQSLLITELSVSLNVCECQINKSIEQTFKVR